MDNEIEKSEQPSHDDVLAAITSFNDPTIITNIFRELGWSYSLEIKETLTLAKQNANLSIKFKAIKHLRELLREAAETAGYTARVSQTIPNAAGGQTTFHAKRIAGALNPVKKIESKIKEPQNDQKETRTEPNRESDREQDKTQRKNSSEYSDEAASPGGTDTRRAFPIGNAELGGTEPLDDGETRGEVAGGADTPCIQTRPPTCDQNLFPGISSAED